MYVHSILYVDEYFKKIYLKSSNILFIHPIGLATIVGMNIVLFYKILVSDYFGSNKATKEDEKQPHYADAPKECEHHEDRQVVGNLPMQMKAAVHRRQPHRVNQIVMSLFDDEQEDPVAVPIVAADWD